MVGFGYWGESFEQNDRDSGSSFEGFGGEDGETEKALYWAHRPAQLLGDTGHKSYHRKRKRVEKESCPHFNALSCLTWSYHGLSRVLLCCSVKCYNYCVWRTLDKQPHGHLFLWIQKHCWCMPLSMCLASTARRNPSWFVCLLVKKTINL